MKTILGLLAASAVALAAPCTPAAAASTRVAVTGTTVIVNSGKERRRPHVGWNDVDAPTTFTCTSGAGCLVVIQAMVEISNSQNHWKICARVDGEDASPGCPQQTDGDHLNGATGNILQSAQVGAGTHTLLTRLFFPNGSEVLTFLRRWEVHYTIYEQ